MERISSPSNGTYIDEKYGTIFQRPRRIGNHNDVLAFRLGLCNTWTTAPNANTFIGTSYQFSYTEPFVFNNTYIQIESVVMCAYNYGSGTGNMGINLYYSKVNDLSSCETWDIIKESGTNLGGANFSYFDEYAMYNMAACYYQSYGYISESKSQTRIIENVMNFLETHQELFGLGVLKPQTLSGTYLAANGLTYVYRTTFKSTEVSETSNVVNYEACKKSRYYTGY